MMSDNISFYDFLEQSEYIFSGFISVVGMENKKTGKIFLVDKPTLRNYKKKYREAESNGTKRPHVTDNLKSIFLNKCRYYIYPEKRECEYTLKNGEKVEPLNVFSAKCVTLFFQITGINFSFLRINPDYPNQKFVLNQKKCLVDLFDSVLTLFKKSVSDEVKLIEKNGKLQTVRVNAFTIKNTVPMNEFFKWMKYLYLRYRYILSEIDSEYLFGFSPILPNENIELLKYNRYVNTQLNGLIFRTGKKYNFYRSNVNVESEFSFNQSLIVLRDIESGLNAIDTADNVKDVIGKLFVLFDLKYWQLGNEKVTVEKFIKKPPKDWKNKCIQCLILYNTSAEIKAYNHDIFDEYKFVSCIIYHSTNTCRGKCEGTNECENRATCEFKKNCIYLSAAKKRIYSLRKTIWKCLETKSPDETPSEMLKLIEIIERICLFYF